MKGIRALTGTLLRSPLRARIGRGGRPEWALAIHGGAGALDRADRTPERKSDHHAGLAAALASGESILRGGGSSLDAVEAAVRVLEDDPLFNAGWGAALTSTGRIELDASIMDGARLEAGAVGVVTRTRNPIRLARAVMERSPHVMLVGEGADAFAREQGLEQVDPDAFRTEERRRQLARWLHGRSSPHDEALSSGTVGAVALDVHGHLAAGTSTGGITGKREGRIGDSAVIGAGTYAADGIGAVSCTGSGEHFIRRSAARQLCDRIAWNRQTLQAAAEATIESIGASGGRGGLIAIDGDGQIAFAMNTESMYRGSVSSRQSARTAIARSE